MGVRRYSARELANSLGLHIRTIQRACNRGDLVGFRTPSGRYHLIAEPALNDWLANEGRMVLAHALSHYRRRRNAGCQPSSTNPATNDNDTNKPK